MPENNQSSTVPMNAWSRQRGAVLTVGGVVELVVDGRADVRREAGVLARTGGVADGRGHEGQVFGLAVEEHAAQHLAGGRVAIAGHRPVSVRRALVDVAA